MIPTSFENEQELQRVLAENPQLLVANGAPPPVLLTRQLTLPDAGTLDLLLLDVDSIPVIVGTTLGTCGDCRRDVVAEAIDYISALAQLTVAQLDEAARGAVGRALLTFAGNDGHDFDRRWASLAMNLRSARVKFIVAVEELQPSLHRMIRLLAEHSSLDVQCVAVAKRREANGDTYYAPSTIVDAGRRLRQSYAAPHFTPLELPSPPEPIDRTPSPKGIRLVGPAASSRKSSVPAWRGSAPYQFVKRAGVWIEAYREDAFAAGSVMAARGAEISPADLGRVQWDG
jgi:hypothetical protein